MGKEKKCCYCSRKFGDFHDGQILRPTIEHLTPTSRGGTQDKRNKMRSCQLCNCMKANMTLEEFKDLLFKNLHPLKINGSFVLRGMTFTYELCKTMLHNVRGIIGRLNSYNNNPHYNNK